MLDHFKALTGRYEATARAETDKADPAEVFARARAASLAGDAEATVTMIGVSMLMRSRSDLFSVQIIRQVCTMAARNNHPLHIATCAYFNALNPIGEREEKRKAVDAELARFEALRQQNAGKPFPGAPFEADIEALKACLPKG